MRGLLRTAGAVALTSIALVLAGCDTIYQTARPLSVTVVNGEVHLAFCLGDAEVTRLVASTRQEIDGTWSEYETKLETFTEVAIPVYHGSSMSLAQEIPSVDYVQVGSFTATEEHSLTSVLVTFLDAERTEHSVSAVFESQSLASIPAGEFLYTDGNIHSNPCEMVQGRDRDE